MERRQFLKVVLVGAVASLIAPSDMRDDGKARNKEQTGVEKPEICRGDIEKAIQPFGVVVCKTEGMPNKNTVVAIKMIHNSRSFPQLRNQIEALQRDIFEMGKSLVGAGVRRIGGEGFDPGEVTKNSLISKGFKNTSYSFINLELYFDEKLESFGYDRKDILQKTYRLLREGRSVEAIKLNPERARGMVNNVARKIDQTKDSCLAIIAGGDHLEKEGEPELKEFVDHVNFMQLFEEKGINVIVVEPRTYQSVSRQIQQIKQED